MHTDGRGWTRTRLTSPPGRRLDTRGPFLVGGILLVGLRVQAREVTNGGGVHRVFTGDDITGR